MALVVGGTTVTGTQTLQASTLTGTASAINGSNITSLPAPSAANVGSATAGINGCSTTVNEGSTIGVTLYWSGGGGQVNQGSPSGTWRAMGYMQGCATGSGTVCLRIS